LVVLGILSGAWLVKSAGDRVAVLAVARPVPFGAVITAQDLTRAEVSADPAVATVPVADIDEVLGLVAATNLAPGSLLTRAAVTDVKPPGPGEVLVAIALPATRMPAGSLQAGDKVLVVDTPPADADAPTLPPSTIPATIVRLGAPDLNGVTVVDVTVADSDGPALAARSATGRIAVVVQPRGN
ncbi:MAG: SAF domain-containing protein, partial [Actinomycetota bacterium]